MAKTTSIVLGIVFLLVGILGLVGTPIVGDAGYFETNTAHDLVHLVSGIIFLIVAFSSTKAIATTMKVFGVVYLLVAILGLVMDGPVLGIVINGADDVLHVVLAIVIFFLGWKVGKDESSAAAPMAA